MENKRTCLYDKHVALGALISPFAGFDMPIQYTSIVDEHNAVRKCCGMFDVSHMGEIIVAGKEAEKYVNYIFTNDVSGLSVNKVLYGMLCMDNGGVVDDTCICKVAEDKFILTVNAANIAKDYDWIKKNVSSYDVEIIDESAKYGQLAIQGPKAETFIKEALGLDGSDLKFYDLKQINDNGENIILSRTGYTGEDGFELYASPNYIVKAWDKLIKAGVTPCGLGCRDTLRFEAGLPLYGHELSEEITPVMAGLSMFVKFDKPEFIGKDALLKQKTEGVSKRLRGIWLDDNAIPRNGYKVFKDGKEIGVITTGYKLISVDRSCAVALVDANIKLEDRVEVQIRKKFFAGTIGKKRFYNPSYKK